MVRYAPGVQGGVVEEFQPVVRTLLDAELPGPFAKGLLVARRRQDFALNLAPIAGVVAVREAKLAQTKPLFRPQFFDEDSKYRFFFVVVK